MRIFEVLSPCFLLNKPFAQSSSIPNAPGAMVGYTVMTFRLHLLDGIVEEEIDQDGVEVRRRVLAHNFPPQQLDAPNTAPTQLNLPWMAAVNGLLLPDVRLQRWTVLEAAERVEHLRDAIVCEHGNLVDVVEGAVAFAFEASPEVGD